MNKESTESSQNIIKEIQGKSLLKLARKTIADSLGIKWKRSELDESFFQQMREDKNLQRESGTFVTLKKHGELRGCIGTILPVDSILSGIQQNSINAAFNDTRFPALKKEEFDQVTIEISILTKPVPLDYSGGNDLIQKLTPQQDGVILRSGPFQATFLPQVWEQLPEPASFLSRLCQKAGLAIDAWKHKQLDVLIYHVQHFEEEKTDRPL